MAFGSLVFALAMLDEWVMELRGRRRASAPIEALRNE